MNTLIAKASAGGLCLAIFIGTAPRAGAYPLEEQFLSRKALEKYKTKAYDAASKLYERATKASQDNALSKYNLGASQAKAGDAAAAEKTFNSVFDPAQPLLNAAAEFSGGVLDHKTIQGELAKKKEEWQSAEGQGNENVEKEITTSIEKLKDVIERYKSAILKAPDDHDMKTNYEIAQRELDDLKKALEQQQPPPQPPQQSQQPQQEQQQKNEDPQQGGKGEQKPPEQQSDQQKQDPQEDQKGQQDQQNKPGEQQQNDQPDPEKSHDPAKDSDQKKDDGQQGQPQQPPQPPKEDPKQQQDSPQGKPEPESTPTPAPQGTPRPAKAQPTPGGQAAPEGEPQEVPIGQMSQEDVDRLLNTLPPEDDQALQRMFNSNYRMRGDMEKDW